jgi:hypothetical protein
MDANTHLQQKIVGNDRKTEYVMHHASYLGRVQVQGVTSHKKQAPLVLQKVSQFCGSESLFPTPLL